MTGELETISMETVEVQYSPGIFLELRQATKTLAGVLAQAEIAGRCRE
jgi:hypothetical protein